MRPRINQSQRYKEHLAQVATDASGVDIDPEDINLMGYYPLYKKKIACLIQQFN